MESLNLNTLAHSLPNTNNLANSEKDLLNNFKAAALSITTLYRSSRHTSKRAYNAGYGAACQDLLVMIQQGVSVGGVVDPLQGAGPMEEGSGNAMTIGKVMDWIEARLEAVKSREEEEDEDEEKEKERGRGGTNTTAASTSKPSVIPKVGSADNVAATSRHKDTHQPVTLPPTPHSPIVAHSHLPPHSLPPSPSPPSTPLHTIRSIHNLPANRPSKSRVTFPAAAQSETFKLGVPTGAGSVSADDTHGMDFVGAGAKRRHTVMMMFDSASSPLDVSVSTDTSPGSASHSSTNANTGSGGTSATPSARRRRRTSRGSHSHGHVQGVHVNGNQQGAEAMDVEEDGRERKRVTRR